MNPLSSCERHFPWVTEHPTALALLLALYPIYSILASTENSFKAQVVNHNANIDDLNKIHDRAFGIGIPLAVFLISLYMAIDKGIPFGKAWFAILIAPFATFVALNFAMSRGKTGERSRLIWLSALLVVFILIALFCRGGWRYTGFGAAAILAFGIALYLLMPKISKVINFIATRYKLFLWVSAIYSVLICSSFLYAVAAWYWDYLHPGTFLPSLNQC